MVKTRMYGQCMFMYTGLYNYVVPDLQIFLFCKASPENFQETYITQKQAGEMVDGRFSSTLLSS